MLPDHMRREGKTLRNDKCIIGLVIEDIGSTYARDLIRDTMDSIPEGDAIRLVVLAGKYDEPGIDLHEYRQVYNLIHHLEEI